MDLELLESIKHSLQEDYEDDGDAPDYAKDIEKLLACKNLSEIMRWQRDMAWDLWSAVQYLAPQLDIETDTCEHGSCQNWHERVCVALALRFGVEEECFWNWST